MKVRILIGIFAIMLCLTMALGLSACSGDEPRVVSIAVASDSLSNTYMVGDTLDITDARLVLTYDNGQTEEIPLTQSMINNEFNTKTPGKFHLNISYYDFECRFSYTVISKPVESLVKSVAVSDTKKEYKIGDVMDLSGSLTVTLTDDRTVSWKLSDIKGLVVKNFKTSQAGDYVCQLEYESDYGLITADYTYKVVPLATVTSVTFEEPLPIRVFLDSTSADFINAIADLPITLNYSDGTSLTIADGEHKSVDDTFDTSKLASNRMVTVTAWDDRGRYGKVTMHYTVIERHEVFTVYFDPNFDKLGKAAETTNPETGKVKQQYYERDGYECTGWYIGDENGDRFDFNTVVTSDMTLVAKWQKLVYKINLMSFGVQEGATISYTVTDDVLIPAPTEHSGHRFLYYSYNGTSLKKNEDGSTFIKAGTFTEHLTLVAVWEPIQYSVDYDLHTPSGATITNESLFESGIYTTIDSRILSTPICNNYVFEGWTLEKGDMEFITSLYGMTGDVTLHANWSASIYYVTLIDATTDTEIGAKVPFSVNSLDIEIKPAEIENYRFEGWFTNRECTEEFYRAGSGKYVLTRGSHTADFTLYAKTTRLYTLYLNREDRAQNYELRFAIGDDDEADYLSQWTAGSARNNCYLESWTCDASELLPELELTIANTEDGPVLSKTTSALAMYDGMTLRAIWGGYEHSITYILYDDVEWKTVVYNSYDGITLDKPTRDGYRFTGWKDKNGETFTRIGKAMYNNDFTFYATWQISTYTLSFLYGIDQDLLTKKLENVNTSPTNYTIDTYQYTIASETFVFSEVSAKYNVFGGWYLSSSYEGEPLDCLPQGSYNVLQLYAKWEPIQYPVRFYHVGTHDFEGATVATPPYVTYQTESLVLQVPTRAGYTFNDWYRDIDATEKVAKNAEGQYEIDIKSVFEQISNSLYSLDFYAEWTAISYTIGYSNGKADGTELKTWTNPNAGVSAYTAESTVTFQAPVSNGYVFLAWYKDKDLTQEIETTAGQYENLVLYPKWTKGTYTITYGNLTAEQVETLELPTEYQLSGELNTTNKFTSAIKNKITRYGYTLTGMYETPDGTGSAVTSLGNASTGATAPRCKDITLYCVWMAKTYTIALKYTNNSGTLVDYKVADWGNKANISLSFALIESGYQLPQMEQTGYVTQTDWYVSTNLEQKVEDGLLTPEHLSAYLTGTNTTLTLCSKFEAQVYHLTYRCVFDDFDLPEATTFTYFTATTIDELADTVTYKWYGWYTDQTYTTRVQNLNKAKSTNNLVVASDLELWAHVEVIRHITYVMEGANELTSPVSTFDDATAVTLPDATYSDKVFSGWYAEGIGNIGRSTAGYMQDITVTPIFMNKGATKYVMVELADNGLSGVVTGFNGSGSCILPMEMGTANMFETSVQVPVNAIAAYAFENSAITSVTIQNAKDAYSGYTAIGNYAFAGSKLSSITIPQSVVTLGSRVFSGCTNLGTATVKGGTVKASSYLFSQCTKLATVELSDNCVIEAYCNMFYKCTALKTIKVYCDTVGAEALYEATALTTLYVKGNVKLSTMFKQVSGTVSHPSTLTALHITGAALAADFNSGLSYFTEITDVYFDNTENVVEVGDAVSAYLSTRTIHVPSKLRASYQSAYPDWTIV